MEGKDIGNGSRVTRRESKMERINDWKDRNGNKYRYEMDEKKIKGIKIAPRKKSKEIDARSPHQLQNSITYEYRKFTYWNSQRIQHAIKVGSCLTDTIGAQEDKL